MSHSVSLGERAELGRVIKDGPGRKGAFRVII